MIRRRAAILAVFVVLAPGAAGAQEQEEEVRSSFMLGGGLGLGGMAFSVDGNKEASYNDATGLQLAFGGMVSPRFALGVDITWLFARDDGNGIDAELRVFERAIGAWARFWVLPRFWVGGGIASVRAGASYTDGEDLPTYDGAQLHGEAGFELLHQVHWSIDLSLRLAAAGYGDEADVNGSLASNSVALLATFAWFR